jgi:hypothetical protein
MLHRSHLSTKERDARSKLRQQLGNQPLLRGSLVEMARVCGKPGCCCESGQKHVSLYLAIRRGSKRTMIYIPPALEPKARQAVQNWQGIDQLLELVSQETLERLLNEKMQHKGVRKRRIP